MSDRKFIYQKLIDALNEISFPDDEEETPKRKQEFLKARGKIRAELQEIANGERPKRRKSAFNMSRYKTHDGERGSTDKWREAAKVILNVNGENCLETLGLSGRPATEEELKKVYRAAIRKAHPDAGGSEDEAARLNAAYELALKLFFSKSTHTATKAERQDTGLRPQLLTPIDEADVDKYLEDDEWCAQEKKDGKHGILKTVFENDKVSLIAANKQGLEMPIPKAIEEPMIRLFGEQDVIFDGEQIGNKFYIFDLLAWQGVDLRKRHSYKLRYEILLQIFPNGQVENFIVVRAAFGTKGKRALFNKLKTEGKEGIVFKKCNALWSEGRSETGGDMIKCKFWASLSAIVSDEVTGKASFSSYVLDPSGDRVDLGRCSALGKVMPQAGDIVEIKYLYAYRGGKLVQQVLLGIRDDVDPEQCTTKQLKYKVGD